MLLAGRDITAGTLNFTFQEMSNNPEIVVRKLMREFLETAGLSKAPTYEDLKNMHYLQHVINETLRLYPGVPANVKTIAFETETCQADDVVPDTNVAV